MNISQRVKNAQPTQCRIDHYQIPVTETHLQVITKNYYTYFIDICQHSISSTDVHWNLKIHFKPPLNLYATRWNKSHQTLITLLLCSVAVAPVTPANPKENWHRKAGLVPTVLVGSSSINTN